LLRRSREEPARNASIASIGYSFSYNEPPRPGTSTSSQFGIAAAIRSPSSLTSRFVITSVGTRIVGRTSVRSRSICMRRNSIHVDGLAVSR
jgi:hypothetical protein